MFEPKEAMFGFQGDFENDESQEFMLFSKQDEDENNKLPVPEELPILTIRNTVLFPGVVFPITVGRDKSIRLIREANKKDKIIGVVSQRNPEIEDPSFEDLYTVGTLAEIVRMMRMPDGSTTVIIQGRKRIELTELTQSEPYLRAKVKALPDQKQKEDKEYKAIIDSIRDTSHSIINLAPNIPSEASIALRNIDSSRFLVHFVASNLNISVAEKQEILNDTDPTHRATTVLEYVTHELQMLELKDQIQNKVRTDIDKQQKEYFLQQQIRALQEELGGDSPDKEILNLREKGNQKKWPQSVHQHFNRELDRLQRVNPASPDYSVGLNYVQLMLDLPWDEYTKDNFDLKHAEKVLDEDHFGLEKVKKRILEYLAVLKLKGDMKSPIICLYGPPGVGKTSLGRSIARALGRKYVRMSLGGLHDESEIRGHRKTYIGAMPGRIIQNLKKVGTSNPVYVLDEIDKMGRDFRGDPSSAMLEVLDPEQNSTFYDNYLELDYDLSKVLFIATANSLDSIQPALLDRMEIIDISGYSLEEKVEIGKKYLIPKQRKAHGLKTKDFNLSDKALELVIEQYTRESGVRGLDKKIAALARNAAKSIAMGEALKKTLGLPEVEKILGSEKMEPEMYESNQWPGVVTGLAWSPMGGSVLFVESKLIPGKGNFHITGQLGDVMKESVTLARSFLKAHSDYLDIDARVFDHWDVHVHFPAGAIPKDGPSAGITILTSLASLFTQRKVKSHLAMTGEITLRGKVLPVGGIKEKILAARRAGITHVILCEANRKDIEDINPGYLKGMKFSYVKNMLEVLDIALLRDFADNPIDTMEPVRKAALKSAESPTV
ncbi:MAG: endopeptidase La [Bacteroidetes bacterium]|nr:endopeptidase La [Bacteroidota bacterium]